MNEQRHIPWEWLVVAAAGVMIVTMGARQSLGLFLAPIDQSTGLGIATISFAMAIAQFVWGAAQPVAGAIADRYGPGRVVVGGLVLLAAGLALTPYLDTGFGLIFTIGLMQAAGTGTASFSVLVGATMRRLPVYSRGMASGIINAGGSFGQFLFAPILQRLIAGFGWPVAMWCMAVAALAITPAARILRRPPQPVATTAAGGGLGASVKTALSDRSYLLLHAGFFTCGFHIAFLVTHLPGEINLCGLPAGVASWSLAIIGLANIVGSLLAGWGVGRYRSKYILFGMYASRTVLIGLFLVAPKTTATFYIFAAGLGFTWLATVPPTAGIVGKLFGPQYLSTLFGLTLLSHQIGGFLGAWLGGLAMTYLGNYDIMWYADAALAAMAAVINLPIREPLITREATA